MTTGAQVSPGMVLEIGKKLFRVESAVKVTMAKGQSFMKTKLKDLGTDKVVEKNFKLDQEIKDVVLSEKSLEFLYAEGKGFLFLDTLTLDKCIVDKEVVGNRVNYLLEGIELKARCYGDNVFAIELPQFLEIMVSDVEDQVTKGKSKESNAPTRVATLETGAVVPVPSFIESGDIIKVDTQKDEYIQRV